MPLPRPGWAVVSMTGYPPRLPPRRYPQPPDPPKDAGHPKQLPRIPSRPRPLLRRALHRTGLSLRRLRFKSDQDLHKNDHKSLHNNVRQDCRLKFKSDYPLHKNDQDRLRLKNDHSLRLLSNWTVLQSLRQSAPHPLNRRSNKSHQWAVFPRREPACLLKSAALPGRLLLKNLPTYRRRRRIFPPHKSNTCPHPPTTRASTVKLASTKLERC